MPRELDDDTIDAYPSGPVLEAGPAGLMTAGEPRYTVGKQIGAGGMGDVLLARDAQIGRDVAIKRMRAPAEHSHARFLREARIQGRLEHPAIVPVHEVGVDASGRPYFVMKRLAGHTLFDILHGAEPPRDKRALARLLRAFADVCLAVEFAHTRGVIHRDLKPANIMLGDFGEVYVLDWGIARVIASDAVDPVELPHEAAPGATRVGVVIGTDGYMPPEQLRGDEVDRRADVFALGCILFEILTLEPLFARRDPAVAEYAGDPRPSVRSPQRDVPPELDELVVRATAPSPADRIAAARDLADAVQAYLDGDRDVAQRQQLSRDQLALARAALGDGAPTEDQRKQVIQHAGRALALDPTTPDAVALLGRLMVEPPARLPSEVVAELAVLDERNLRDQARVAGVAFVIYVAFIPLMRWVGVTDPFYLGLVGALSVLSGLLALALTRYRRPIPAGALYLIIGVNIALMFVLARMFGTFLVAPALACATMLALAMHPRFGNTLVIALGLAGAITTSWLGELAGWWQRTVEVVDGAIVLHSAGGRFLHPNLEIAHGLYLIALVAIVGALSRTLARTQREARSEAVLQAWHLRHLVPPTG